MSGPVRRPPAAPRPTQAPRPPPALHRVVDHPLLDRLIRGRTWIGIVAFALIGIVAMQVALLKLNAGIGRSVQRSAALARENSLLSGQVSTLQAADLRQAEATHQGMVFAPAGDVRYLTAGATDAAQAVATMVAPSAAAAAATSRTSVGAGASGQSSTAGGASGTAASGSGSNATTPAAAIGATGPAVDQSSATQSGPAGPVAGSGG